jgi:NAD(P)-dependent dehydrogenase (short-subunit alcohol dehydrogenase family)
MTRTRQGNKREAGMDGRKAIFITGGASGIGRAVAQHFGSEGWFVGLADINEAGLAETAGLIASGQSSTHRLDVRDRAAWDIALADFAEQSGGRLDVLFNNAGIARGGAFTAVSHADHDLMIDINLKGVINGAEAGFAWLAKTPGSCLLNTCSAAGLVAGPGLAVYAVTKFGVRALTEALESEWAPHGIKVASLMPSFIETPLLDGATSGTNHSVREQVIAAKMEITPVGEVALAAWKAVHGRQTHVVVGKSARRLKRILRWFPDLPRRSMGRQFAKGAETLS